MICEQCCERQDRIEVLDAALKQAIGLGKLRLESSRNHRWIRGGDHDVPEFKAKTTGFIELAAYLEAQP